MRFPGFCVAMAAVALLLAPASASAHPVGNFSVNRYSRIEIGSGGIAVHYVVDMAEIPTLAEQAKLDRNHDGTIAEEERSGYLTRIAGHLARNLDLELDGSRVPLSVESTGLEFLPGQAGLQTMRLTLVLSAPVGARASRATALIYRDDNFSAEVGWGEVVVRGGEGVAIPESTAPPTDVTNELRSYPPNAADRPPDRRDASATFMLVANQQSEGSANTGSSWNSAARSSEPASAPAAGLADRPQDNPSSPANRFASSEGIAGPLADAVRGVVSGTEGRPPDALAIALALLLAALWGAAHALSPGHGKTVVAAYLVGSRGTPLHALYLGLTVTATHTLGVYLLGAVTLLAAQFLPPDTLYRWLAVASSLGVVLIGGTLAVGRAGGILGRGAHAHSHGHDGHSHDHLDHPHSHLSPGSRDATVTWRSLLALGVAGGLLPCPSALVLFLGALALGQVGFGLILVVAFSAGLAVVLTAVGIAFVYARRVLSFGKRSRPSRASAILSLAPLGSALFILAVGLAMSVDALERAGFLRL